MKLYEVKNAASRKQEVANIRSKFPNKIPVIVERYGRESSLPLLDKTRFLVPQELTMSQFVTILRNRMQLQTKRSSAEVLCYFCYFYYLTVIAHQPNLPGQCDT
ncbi:hypothetical protein Pmani_032752 [Petrolisthes manimaculis]|uniref:Autophagy-related protein n=1 Tax=Petrolisthes manimaculis TaxID=1843537 RepID=A0AAE1NS13_9EUCA|nr:hypothetical protein Pmani_032752 [Petrolisthes manimaculis]